MTPTTALLVLLCQLRDSFDSDPSPGARAAQERLTAEMVQVLEEERQPRPTARNARATSSASSGWS